MAPPTDPLSLLLGQIPSGLSILTARNAQGEETGMLASWIQQAGFSPPSFTLAVNKSRYLVEWLQPEVSLAVSLIGESQKQLLGHFGKGFEPGAPAFEGLNISRTPRGLAVLSESIGWMEGTVQGRLDAGDHVVVLVSLTASQPGPLHGTERPWIHVRKSGAHY